MATCHSFCGARQYHMQCSSRISCHLPRSLVTHHIVYGIKAIQTMLDSEYLDVWPMPMSTFVRTNCLHEACCACTSAYPRHLAGSSFSTLTHDSDLCK
ncbi:hypothetical protein DYB25_006702 [Aphanomyces astaci]|uniref:Uncharacterized protein n=1 Tax=Aphanomyces astaci TaxID=112090 RepID=A0A397EMS4_APHAT|nr:hypothetical protein DYB36_011184 [Aphanomyces astaci]RHY11485.1 hypothetical protein DYB25_006702 [Aphanomyces astaci]RHY59867.1 hypothetical protein DYB38_012263 [Aphanomyces astaci]RHY75561.1 hypothetical protein DYB34_014099 [Aphanomyces astaci]RHZ00250.1 hypothetical protein DYB31_006707 [Aphanomyces astaci]